MINICVIFFISACISNRSRFSWVIRGICFYYESNSNICFNLFIWSFRFPLTIFTHIFCSSHWQNAIVSSINAANISAECIAISANFLVSASVVCSWIIYNGQISPLRGVRSWWLITEMSICLYSYFILISCISFIGVMSSRQNTMHSYSVVNSICIS